MMMEGAEVESSAGPAKSIEAIDKASVHRICSGQVVLNLGTAIKELVENSVDAGATNIEIRLKDYGAELLEVVDNGKGVDPENFVGLTLKHHTSKLQDFTDLVSVETFGFRGEALSSLCALSKMTITTCHQEASVGTRLEYDHNGKLITQTPCPRQRGTTVTLERLFSTLPVRHKEFLRHIKREFSRAVHVLNAYCIIATGVRITCTNVTPGGKKQTVVNTGGHTDLLENIASIFGHKQSRNLQKMVEKAPTQDVCEEYGLKALDSTPPFSIRGYLSSGDHGCGRSSADRQFYFINTRPCDPTKISRLVNETYHSFNRHQFPFIVLDISLDKECVDVNVTPDKRQIFIQEEKRLLASIKCSLLAVLGSHQGRYTLSKPVTTPATPDSFVSGESSNQTQKQFSSLAKLKRTFSSAFSKPISSDNASNKQRKLDLFFKSPGQPDENVEDEHNNLQILEHLAEAKDESKVEFQDETPNLDTLKPTYDTSQDAAYVQHDDTDPHTTDNAQDLENTDDDGLDLTANGSLDTSVNQGETVNCSIEAKSTCTSDGFKSQLHSSRPCANSLSHTSKLSHGHSQKDGHSHGFIPNSPSKGSSFLQQFRRGASALEDSGTNYPGDESETKSPGLGISLLSFQNEREQVSTIEKRITDLENNTTDQSEHKRHTTNHSLNGSVSDKVSNTENVDITETTYTEYDSGMELQRKEREVTFSMSAIRKSLKARSSNNNRVRECRGFRAGITPTDNSAAEDELRREINQQSFRDMVVLGQFNLGFIIARLARDLFIIDQHASDEKYNYEQLQQHTVIQSQALIVPQDLLLTAANQCVLQENLDIFTTNGFHFNINPESCSNDRICLTRMPVSKNWTFGKDDIEELIFMLTDSPGIMCRPTRIKQMFASRACRKSVMVGTALTCPQMYKVVKHMAEMDQPWNCPHGRPTMRHLINLDMLPD